MRGKWTWTALCILFSVALALGLRGANASDAPSRGVTERRISDVELALRVRRYEEGAVIVSADADTGAFQMDAPAYERPFYLALAFGAVYLVCEGVASRGGRKKT